MDGLDEISIAGPTSVAEIKDHTVTTYSITPEEFGIRRAPLSAIAGGLPNDNAERIRGILGGEKGPCRDIVVLNAAFALTAAGLAVSAKEGVPLAERSIDSGAALRKLEQLVAATKS
jgi:anthranilate phosphoribosyltransferase